MWHGGLCQTLIFGVNFGGHFCYLVLGPPGGRRGSYSQGNSQQGMLNPFSSEGVRVLSGTSLDCYLPTPKVQETRQKTG